MKVIYGTAVGSLTAIFAHAYAAESAEEKPGLILDYGIEYRVAPLPA